MTKVCNGYDEGRGKPELGESHLPQPCPYSAEFLETNQGKSLVAEVREMERRGPPYVGRNVTLAPLDDPLARVVYTLYPHVLQVARDHHTVHRTNRRLLAIEVYLMPDLDHMLRTSSSSKQAKKEANNGREV